MGTDYRDLEPLMARDRRRQVCYPRSAAEDAGCHQPTYQVGRDGFGSAARAENRLIHRSAVGLPVAYFIVRAAAERSRTDQWCEPDPSMVAGVSMGNQIPAAAVVARGAALGD